VWLNTKISHIDSNLFKNWNLSHNILCLMSEKYVEGLDDNKNNLNTIRVIERYLNFWFETKQNLLFSLPGRVFVHGHGRSRRGRPGREQPRRFRIRNESPELPQGGYRRQRHRADPPHHRAVVQVSFFCLFVSLSEFSQCESETSLRRVDSFYLFIFIFSSLSDCQLGNFIFCKLFVVVVFHLD